MLLPPVRSGVVHVGVLGSWMCTLPLCASRPVSERGQHELSCQGSEFLLTQCSEQLWIRMSQAFLCTRWNEGENLMATHSQLMWS